MAALVPIVSVIGLFGSRLPLAILASAADKAKVDRKADAVLTKKGK